MKIGPSAFLQIKRQNIRRVRPEVAAKIFAHLGLRQFREIFGEFRLGISPGEIGVALGEAGLGQRLHHLWLGERLGEKDHVRELRPHSGDQYSQNATGLVCGLSTRKIRTPRSAQKSMTLFISSQSSRQFCNGNSADKCLRIFWAGFRRI